MLQKILIFCLIFIIISIGVTAGFLHYEYHASIEGIAFHLQYGNTLLTNNYTYLLILAGIIVSLIVSISVYIIIYKYFSHAYKLFLIILTIFTLVFVDRCLSIVNYIRVNTDNVDLYKRSWQKPEAKYRYSIKKSNLILLLLESVEDSYSDPKFLGKNTIPYLTEYKNKGISFSNFQQTSGTWWTIASVVGSWCGIPLNLPIEFNVVYNSYHFMPNAICLSDILKSNDYTIIYTKGSNSKFAGLDVFLQSHGVEKENIIDLKNYLALNKENLVSWGVADSDVYESFKLKLQQLSKQEKPFFATMQTINTHFPFNKIDYECHLEKSNFAEIVKCSDRQAGEFIDWFLEQDFASNTVLVIVGDHKLMEKSFGVNTNILRSERRIYNLFINSKAKPDGGTDRSFTQLDLFPSILESIGMEVKNRRAGLGVSVFAPKTHQTLLEKLGQKELDKQLLARDPIYNSFLSPKLVKD